MYALLGTGAPSIGGLFDVSDEATTLSCVSSTTFPFRSDSIKTFQEKDRVLQTKLGFL